MLNAYFESGAVPACVTSTLVNPVHKKGNDLDTAIYRPIAVGEPLYRLYTTILYKRIVDCSEQHDICSPVPEGFRPNLSTVHHIFALRHMIDRALLRHDPLYPCFVDI